MFFPSYPSIHNNIILCEAICRNANQFIIVKNRRVNFSWCGGRKFSENATGEFHNKCIILAYKLTHLNSATESPRKRLLDPEQPLANPTVEIQQQDAVVSSNTNRFMLNNLIHSTYRRSPKMLTQKHSIKTTFCFQPLLFETEILGRGHLHKTSSIWFQNPEKLVLLLFPNTSPPYDQNYFSFLPFHFPSYAQDISPIVDGLVSSNGRIILNKVLYKCLNTLQPYSQTLGLFTFTLRGYGIR